MGKVESGATLGFMVRVWNNDVNELGTMFDLKYVNNAVIVCGLCGA